MHFKTDHLIYGGDYNPEQWEDREDILEEDIRLMKEAHVNEVTLGVFSWAKEEPSEGEYNLSWLRRRVDILYENGIETILATPSGARPRWLAEKYPEVLRVDETRHRNLFGERHNHCYTSPVYREKVWEIDHRLAEEFRHHPGIKAWHISNEFGGDCHCPLCQKDFRNFLWEKYDGDIDRLNHAWWNTFWSHNYDSFEQIESPSSRGETSVNGLDLDWKRFVTHQTTDFMKHEIAALRDGGAMQPVTTNFMYDFDGLDYEELAKHLDVISWDSYPGWYGKEDILSASDHAFYHDVMRSLKKKPFLLMESSTTSTNWMPVSRLRRPGILENASLSAVAHGSDSVQYFQIRAGRGGQEKLHGALIDHYGKTDTRIFGESRHVGETLEKLSEVAGTLCDAKTAILYDTQNRWALEGSFGPRNCGMGYHDLARKCYRGVKAAGLDTDIFSPNHDLTGYKLIIVPMLYMFRGDIAERLEKFVKKGGILVMTYWSGVVDETDLTYLGGTPHGLTDVLGLRFEEIDSLPDAEYNHISPVSDNSLGLTGSYFADKLCELIKPNGASTLMTYDEDWYAGYPAVLEHEYGKGRAYYVCADMEEEFYREFIPAIAKRHRIKPLIADVPYYVDVASRVSDSCRYIFIQNYGVLEEKVKLPAGCEVLLGSADGVLSPASTTIVRVDL